MQHPHPAGSGPGSVIDPDTSLLLGRDAALPAVPRDTLTLAGLRRRFASPPAWQPEVFEDSIRLNELPLRAAAVLVPIVARPEGLRLLLTTRNADLHEHAGQISFPGGRRDRHDLHPAATALREAREEIGLSPQGVELLGDLPVYRTASRYSVTPVVALLPHAEGWVAQPAEVSEVFEVPLDFLMDPAHHEQREWIAVDGETNLTVIRRRFLSIPYVEGGRRYVIWGATAAMIRNLYRLLIA